jgi:phage terminase small subunit
VELVFLAGENRHRTRGRSLSDSRRRHQWPDRNHHRGDVASITEISTTASMKSKLNAKQLAFCQEYLIDLNATQAAIRAGYSAKTARQVAAENLTKPDIQTEVSRLIDERAARNKIDADTVLGELLRIARADIGQAFNPDGSLKPLADMPEEIRRAISGVDVFEEFAGRGEDREQIGFTKKIRFWDKVKALEMLGRHLRMFSDRVELTGKDGGPLEVAQPGRPAEEVADFSKQMFAAFQAFRDDDGTAAQLDAQAISSVSECVAGFAAGIEGRYEDPVFLGGQFAKIWCIRKKMQPPAGYVKPNDSDP